jgi:dienelactone hydrolase
MIGPTRCLIASAILAIIAITTALTQLRVAYRGVIAEPVQIGTIPATVFRPAATGPTPVVLIAHGFAGSRQLMQSFALACARNGYIAVTFDFAGHGRNPAPMTGDITQVSGTTQVLVAETAAVARYARQLGDGRLAVLGHSMASDIIVRFAQQTPDISATIAVSMFSPAVTASTPRNLLIIVGGWEGFLKKEALRAVGLASAPAAASAGVTYGDFGAGTARRTAFSANVEHVGVLYSRDSLREAIEWLDKAFGVTRQGAPIIDSRGPWILLLLGGVVLLARPLARLLPVVAAPPVGAGRGWRQFWPLLVAPMITTPLLLRVLPTHFLPVIVGDYLALHFLVYGLITSACLWWLQRDSMGQRQPRTAWPALAVAVLAVLAFFFIGLALPLDSTFTSFLPGAQRMVLIVVMLAGTMSFFLSDEMITRGASTARGAYLVSKLAFIVSLAIAVALDFRRLFFLIIIVPVVVLFFIVQGLFSRWCYRRTGHPWVAGIANAVAFAWAIGVTFPLVAG